MVRSAEFLFDITDNANLWMKSDLRPRASRWSSSSHIDRLSTCKMRSKVSFDTFVCLILSPRKKVLYSRTETIAIRSL